jgi:hypothetical protein
MACIRTAEVASLVFFPLNVRSLPNEKVAGDCGFLPAVTPNNNFNSISDSNFKFDFSITGGVSWRPIS